MPYCSKGSNFWRKTQTISIRKEYSRSVLKYNDEFQARNSTRMAGLHCRRGCSCSQYLHHVPRLQDILPADRARIFYEKRHSSATKGGNPNFISRKSATSASEGHQHISLVRYQRPVPKSPKREDRSA